MKAPAPETYDDFPDPDPGVSCQVTVTLLDCVVEFGFRPSLAGQVFEEEPLDSPPLGSQDPPHSLAVATLFCQAEATMRSSSSSSSSSRSSSSSSSSSSRSSRDCSDSDSICCDDICYLFVHLFM